jgi:hypothetical protein
MTAHQSNIRELWRDDPLAEFYNVERLSDVILTADTDWAPDFVIEQVIDLVAQHGHKITIFATHQSEVLHHVPDFVEVGLHPDYTMRHNQLPFDEVMRRMKEWYPEAVGTRSHCDFFGNNVANLAVANGLIYDVSVFEWNMPFCQGHIDYNRMVRFSYFWEDGIHMDMNFPLTWEDVRLATPGLKIMNVHPILIYLNCETDDDRRRVVRPYKDLTRVQRSDIDPFIRQQRGIRDLWVELLESLTANNVRTHLLGDVARHALEHAQAPAAGPLPKEIAATLRQGEA